MASGRTPRRKRAAQAEGGELSLAGEIVELRGLIRRRIAEGADISEIVRAIEGLARVIRLAKVVESGGSLDSVLSQIVDEVAAEVKPRATG